MTTTLHSIRCNTCNGTAAMPLGDDHVERCTDCNGFGWIWSDGKAPTFCPSTTTTTAPRPCSRYGNTCTGCGRSVDEVGNANDTRATRKAKGL